MKEGEAMEKGMTPVQWMDKAVKCLYLELPESIANDVSKRWESAKEFLMSPEAARHHQSPVGAASFHEQDDMMYCSHCNQPIGEHPSSLTGDAVEGDKFEFAEWASHNDWTYLPSKSVWHNEEQEENITPKTTEQLYKLFLSTRSDH